MRRIRFGKDIAIKWAITTNGEDVSLVGRDLKLLLIDPNGREIEMDFTVGGENGNELTFSFFGIKHTCTGTYRLTLWENYHKVGQTAVDKTNAFRIVATTDLEGADPDE